MSATRSNMSTGCFGARRPILTFLPRDSEMRQVLETAGMAEFTCDEYDVEGGAAAMQRLWNRYQSGTLSINTEQTAYWSSDIQLARYVKILTFTDGGA